MKDILPATLKNERHQMFVEHYSASFNAQEAALSAGFSKKGAKQQGYSLLKREDVQGALRERMVNKFNSTRMEADEVINMLTSMATVDPLDVYDDNGNVRPLKDIPKAARLCITEISHGQFGMRVKFDGRLKALELIGRHLKMWSEAVNLNLRVDGEQVNVVVNMGS